MARIGDLQTQDRDLSGVRAVLHVGVLNERWSYSLSLFVVVSFSPLSGILLSIALRSLLTASPSKLQLTIYETSSL
jgi:hypothetical protein